MSAEARANDYTYAAPEGVCLTGGTLVPLEDLLQGRTAVLSVGSNRAQFSSDVNLV